MGVNRQLVVAKPRLLAMGVDFRLKAGLGGAGGVETQGPGFRDQLGTNGEGDRASPDFLRNRE